MGPQGGATTGYFTSRPPNGMALGVVYDPTSQKLNQHTTCSSYQVGGSSSKSF